METVTISKEEYDKLKKSSEIDMQLLKMFERSLDDLKHGRVKEL